MKNLLFLALLILSGLCIAVFLPEGVLLVPFEEPMQPVATLAGSSVEEITCNAPETSENCYDLSVNYTDTRSTETYAVESIPFSPYLNLDNSSNLGEAISFVGENRFSPTLNIFPFAFFDKTYDQIAIGENGVISFDNAQGGLINLRYPDENNPNPDLTRNSIFAVQHDMIIEQDLTSEVYFKIEGVAPARRVIITYYEATVFYCLDGRKSTIQIVLEELTNEIEVHILSKPQQCGVNQESLLGIINDTGLQGYSPPNRNTGIWEANNESWLFKPSGERVPIIQWYNQNYVPGSVDNIVIGTGENVNLCVSDEAFSFVVEVAYPAYRDENNIISPLLLSDIITVADDYPIGTNATIIACNDPINLLDYSSDFVLNVNASFNYSFHNTEIDAENFVNPIPNPTNYDINGNEVIWARIYTSIDCFDVIRIELSSLLDILDIDLTVTSLDICDNISNTNAEGIELNLNADDFNNAFLSGLPANAEVYYYSSATASNPQATFNVTNGMPIWLEIVLPNSLGTGQCRTDRYGPFTLNLIPPAGFDVLPTNIEIAVCDIDFDYIEEIVNIGDEADWLGILASAGLVTSNPTSDIVRMFRTYDNAVNASNEITNLSIDINDPNYDINDNSISVIYYLRVENTAGCYTIEPVDINIRFYGVQAVDSSLTTICFDGTEDIPVDLSCWVYPPEGGDITSMFTQIYGIENGEISQEIADLAGLTYHLTIAEAKNGTNPVSPNQVITQDGFVENVNFYVRFTLCYGCGQDSKDCYTVKKIKFRLLNPAPQQTLLTVCTTSGGPTEIGDMSYFDSQIFENPALFDVTYYANQTDAQNTTNPLTNYTFNGGEQIWVYITPAVSLTNTSCFSQSDVCFGVYPVTISLEITPGTNEIIPIDLENICDNNATLSELIDLTIYQSNIVQSFDEIKWYENYNYNTGQFSDEIPNPTVFEIYAPDGEINLSVFARLNFIDESCYNIIEFQISLSFKPSILLQSNFLCSCLPSASEYADFNLTDGSENMFLSENNGNYNFDEMIITYYNFYEDALGGENSISNTTDYSSIRSIEDIFVRFYSPVTECYSIDTLQLKNLVLPIPIPGEYQVCDENFNDLPDLVLSELDEVVMPMNTIGYTFSYYLTLEDAQNSTNSLLDNPNPDNLADYFYEFISLPNLIYVRVDPDIEGCSGSFLTNETCNGIEQVELSFGDSIPFSQTVFDLAEVCDTNLDGVFPTDPRYNDGIIENLDLTLIEADIYSAHQGSSPITGFYYYDSLTSVQNDPFPFGLDVISDPTNYTNESSTGESIQTIYVKAFNDGGQCSTLLEVNINVLPAPYVITAETYYLCPDTFINISPELPSGVSEDDYSYLWLLPDGSTQTGLNLLEVNQIGLYSIQLIDLTTGCVSPKIPVIVQEVNPPIIRELIVIDYNTVTVIATSFIDEPLQYSLDGITWQDINVFYDVPVGVATFYARYNYNTQTCVSDPMETLILDIKNVITPNGDGINDVWVIDNLYVFGERKTLVQIFDRYGKEIFNVKSNDKVIWDGFYEGRPLNSTDYWYILTLPDNRQFNGSISVIQK